MLARFVAESERPASDGDIGPVVVCGERLSIPMRVYIAPKGLLDHAWANSTEAHIAACLLTRHHDGHVRELAFAAVLDSPRDWTPPYVVQLLGEYVVEIVERISTVPSVLDHPSVGRFVIENPDFLRLVRARATSYWDCYHRHRWPKKSEYPAMNLLDRVDVARKQSQDP